MNGLDYGLFIIAGGLLCAGSLVGGLLLGWRFGRESVHKPMFEYKSAPADDGDKVVPVQEDDIWSMLGRGEDIH